MQVTASAACPYQLTAVMVAMLQRNGDNIREMIEQRIDDQADRIRELKNENRELKNENRELKAAAAAGEMFRAAAAMVAAAAVDPPLLDTTAVDLLMHLATGDT